MLYDWAQNILGKGKKNAAGQSVSKDQKSSCTIYI